MSASGPSTMYLEALVLVVEAVPLTATLFLAGGLLPPESNCSESSSSRIKGSNFRSFTVNSTLFNWKIKLILSSFNGVTLKLAHTFLSLSLPVH